MASASQQPARVAAIRLPILLVMLFFVPAETLLAAIRYSDATLEQTERAVLLDATAVIELNRSIESGLESGVPLFFNATVTLKKKNPWWFDSRVYQKVYRCSLTYYELTRHYRVSWAHESGVKNFRSLLDALDSIGSFNRLALDLDAELEQDVPYVASIELALDQNALPLPLRPIGFVNADWRLKSEEYQWQIN